MSWHDLIPKTSFSPEAMEALAPVLEAQKLFNRGHYPEAEATFRRALEHFPQGSAGRVLIHNKLGILYEKTGDSRRALESYTASAAEGALTPFTYQRLGELHLGAGRFPEALGCARKGLQVLKQACTNVPQELFFWFVFQRLKYRIARVRREAGRNAS